MSTNKINALALRILKISLFQIVVIIVVFGVLFKSHDILRWFKGCDRPVPGYITIYFKKDIRPLTQLEFVRKVLFDTHSIRESDIQDPSWSPDNFWALTERSTPPNLPSLNMFTSTEIRYSTYPKNNQIEIQKIAERMKLDTQITVKKILNNYIVIEIAPESTHELILKKYPDLIEFPIENSLGKMSTESELWKTFVEMGNDDGHKILLAHKTMENELNIIQNIREKVVAILPGAQTNVAIGDGTITFLLPRNLSPKEREQINQSLPEERPQMFGDIYDSLTFNVGPGNENKYIGEMLTYNTLVERAFITKKECHEIGPN